MNKNIKKYNGLAHPPLSGESLAGRGFWVLEKSFFGGKKGRHSNKNVMLNFTKRTAAAKRGRVSLYAELFQHLMFVRPGDKEIPKPVRNDNRVCAFTLAEVLITLVIIGVVAALTIPNLMTKYQHHVLENQFKKSVATINHALSLWVYEEGSGLSEKYTVYDNNTQQYTAGSDFATKFWSYIKKTDFTKNDISYQVKNYNNTNSFQFNIGRWRRSQRDIYQTIDGSLMDIFISDFEINIVVDTNGLKGPNRLGYDFFYFIISDKDTLTVIQEAKRTSNRNRAICNLTDTTNNNGRGCAYYALRNKCPYDDTKTYWECLK